MASIKHERLSAEFEKWLFTYRQKERRYFHAVFHHFTGIDRGGPHSHPWNFTSHVLAGSYIERAYTLHPDGHWTSELIHRLPQTSHQVTAATIHEIVALPEGECWTVVVPTSPRAVPWHFWRFDETGVYRRLPRERRFQKFDGWKCSGK